MKIKSLLLIMALLFTASGYANFTIENNVLIRYTGEDAEVKIPEGVTTIGNGAFKDNHTVKVVDCPNSLRYIGASAFYRCISLNFVSFYSPSVVEIGASAFYECSSLDNITLPESVTKIGTSAFYQCTSLSSINIPPKVGIISTNSFFGCGKLEDVTVQGTAITKVELGAFQTCRKLTSIKFKDGLTLIEQSAFRECNVLDTVVLPNSVKEIQDDAFRDCLNLKSINIPDKLTVINNSVFLGCSSLPSVSIPESVTKIGQLAFSNCRSLASVKTPNNLKTIDRNAFINCESLESIVIPNSVTSMVSSVFGGCTGLREITVQWTTPYVLTATSSIFDASIYPECKLNVPEGTLEAYRNALTWKKFSNIVEYPIFSVSDTILVRYNGIDSDVSIPEGISVIGANAFTDNTILTSVTMPNTVTSIGDSAFYGCNKLTSIKTSSAESRMLRNGMEQESLILPDNVETVGTSSFENCKSITSLLIPQSVTAIESRAFANCTGLRQVTVEWDTPLPLLPESEVFDGIDPANCELIFPSASLTAYQSAPVWKDFVRSTTGLDTDKSGEIQVIANSDGLYVTNATNCRLIVFNLQGQAVYSITITGKKELVTACWPAGVYMITLKGDNVSYATKIISM